MIFFLSLPLATGKKGFNSLGLEIAGLIEFMDEIFLIKILQNYYNSLGVKVKKKNIYIRTHNLIDMHVCMYTHIQPNK